VDQTIHCDAYTTAVFGYCDNRICSPVEILADTAREIVLDTGSKRFADIHLSSGDLYAHE